jgi:hypothetical protein
MWSTRTQAIAALRVQVQDEGATQRYTDAELGRALDEAIAELSMARPILILIQATLDAGRTVRLVDTTDGGTLPYLPWMYWEQAGQQVVAMPSLPVGSTVAIGVRGGYGFTLPTLDSGTLDTNIPPAWREAVIAGAQGFALDLYGAREVGRTNIAPAVAQQTARAASVKLRDYRQWLRTLPVSAPQHHEVAWGLSGADGGSF